MPLRMSAIHANKERCPTMHFPSVVHLAPRRNDLFDVYSRSLTLIKITAGPSFASLFLSLSLSLFWGSFACIASFLLRFTLRRSKGLPSGMGTEPPSGFSLFTPCSCSAERDPCSYFARGSSYTGCPRNHAAKISFLGFNEKNIIPLFRCIFPRAMISETLCTCNSDIYVVEHEI